MFPRGWSSPATCGTSAAQPALLKVAVVDRIVTFQASVWHVYRVNLVSFIMIEREEVKMGDVREFSDCFSISILVIFVKSIERVS